MLLHSHVLHVTEHLPNALDCTLEKAEGRDRTVTFVKCQLPQVRLAKEKENVILLRTVKGFRMSLISK